MTEAGSPSSPFATATVREPRKADPRTPDNFAAIGNRRIATADIEIGEITVRAGDGLIFDLSAANWDEHEWEKPDRLDVTRPAAHHLGFGPHQCVGQQLARAELRIIFETLLRRIPTLRLAIPLDDIELNADPYPMFKRLREESPLFYSEKHDLNIGAQMPMKTIGMLLGIPEEDQEAIRDFADDQMRTEEGKPMKAASEGLPTGEIFERYLEWRVENPSDDIMTELMNVEFEDQYGVERKLTREELLTYINVVSGAGNETTTRLIGWAGKVLAEHPDQRRELAENPRLIPKAVEELLRFEPPASHVARYVTRDVEIHGRTVPEGSVMMMLIGAANRDHRVYPPDGDVFDIHRGGRQHLSFSVGTHFCLGSALARLEGRVALEEILKRFPEWEVDMSNARLSPTSTVRGWESLPASTA